MRIINPATEEVITEVAEDTAASVSEKYGVLRAAQPAWAQVPLSQRIKHLAQFSRLLEEQKTELAQTLSAEMGKPLQQSLNEINGSRGRIEFFVERSPQYLAEEWVNQESDTQEKIVYEPLGVVANISAWNYPYSVGVNVFVPALIAGNTVMYKPSEYATLSGQHIQRLLYEAEIPEECFQVAVGKGSVGSLLFDLDFDGYFFTGSYRTGKTIAQAVAKKLVPCQLELGGKDPLYVMEDVADVEKAAEAALEGIVYNAGQSCCAVERIYVHKEIFDPFVKALVEKAAQLTVGDPMSAETDVGPLARKEQQSFLLSQLKDATDQGAKIICGGRIPERKGFFIEPTVVVDVNHRMRLMSEESFGPVIGVQQVENDQEALEKMTDTEYGLTAAIYSADFARAERLMKQLNVGTVYWNCCDRVSATLPWSGRKHSGLGSTLSHLGIRAFVQPKAWHIRRP